jgi:hypothetical protein
LEIWQRQQAMLSVNYNDADEIEITAFRHGVGNSVRLQLEWEVNNGQSGATETAPQAKRSATPIGH